MTKFTALPAKSFLTAVLGLVVLAMTAVVAEEAEASVLTTDLQALVGQGNDVNTQLAAVTLTTDSGCTDLRSTITSVRAFTADIDAVTGKLTAPLSVEADSLTALDDLSLVSTNMASMLAVLSADISALSLNSELADIQAALDAMLQLSDDIGTMADRILEMGDKILVMSDNIGIMADRILLTQQIQSSNMALTQASILSTQQNVIALSGTVDTSSYNIPLDSLLNSGNTLSLDMNNTVLSENNMDTELADFESRVNDYLNSIMFMFNTVNADSSIASHYINSDTLTMLGDLSIINAALADSLNRYAQAVNTLAPDTNIKVLNDAVYSMLRLASDIGVMAGRIVEMGDKINIMADNIGLMSLRIVETQTLQQANLELTLSNLSSAQITTVAVISAYGL